MSGGWQVRLQGVPGIRKVFLRQTKSKVADFSGRGFSEVEEWVLDTEGVNLAEASPPFPYFS